MRFGLRVTVVDEAGVRSVYEITGEDEAEAALGRIAPQSPLARALMGAVVGDEVMWHKPTGAVALEIVEIAHADPHA